MIDDPRDPTTDTAAEAALDAEETEFSNDHPLASPNELAGDAMSGVEMEFLARDIADAEGAASGAALEEDVDTLPLEGE
ncbi:hypothetical protein V6R86_06175 [Sphingomonas kaistensis]|uniref:Conjugal transfer protein TraD n=1 Tax=Sphingomonas kaistensis TaxID=298708 RepID=A0ABZ2G3E9_9SPHN